MAANVMMNKLSLIHSSKHKEVIMPNDQKNQSTQGNKKGMQDEKNRSGSKGTGQSTTGTGRTGSSGKKNNGK